MQDWYSWACWTVTFIYYYSILHNHVAPYCPWTTHLWHSLCPPYKTSKTGVKLHPYWPDWVKKRWWCHFSLRARITFSLNSAHTGHAGAPQTPWNTNRNGSGQGWVLLQRPFFFAFWAALSHSAQMLEHRHLCQKGNLWGTTCNCIYFTWCCPVLFMLVF